MNPPGHNSNPASVSSAVEQVNNQEMCNVNGNGGLLLFPNNMPIVAPPSGFMNFPNQPFSLQNQFLNNTQQNFSPFPVNQFNSSQQQQQQQLQHQQQHGQLFARNSMNPTVYNQNVGEQVLLHNTIQNICQLLQLQNAQCPPPMFHNQIGNVMTHQNPRFLSNQQFGVQHAIANQGHPFLPASVQTQQPHNILSNLTNFQNQIPQGVGPPIHDIHMNQMFGMANSNGPMQHVNHGQPRFVSPMMDVNAPRQIVNTGQTQNSCPTLTNLEVNIGNRPTNVNGQHKNFTGHKTNDASHKRFKSHKHVKEMFGIHNGNMSKEVNSNSAIDSGPRNSTNFEKKVPSLKYTEQEIKQWREARKKHYPKSMTVEKKSKKEQTLSDVTNQAAMLRRQQLKEILAKQAELGLEVADIPLSYLSSSPVPAHEKQNPRDKKKTERDRYKKGKKRGTRRFQDNRIAKRTHEQKLNEREPSLLQKLLTRDIKRDKNHLFQVFRFIAVNSFFNGETLRFPSIIVRETNPQEAVSSISKGSSDKPEAEEEGEITD